MIRVVNDPMTLAGRLRPVLLRLARELRREIHSLGVTGYPESFLIDRQGRIVALNRGPVSQQWLDANLPKILRTRS